MSPAGDSMMLEPKWRRVLQSQDFLGFWFPLLSFSHNTTNGNCHHSFHLSLTPRSECPITLSRCHSHWAVFWEKRVLRCFWKGFLCGSCERLLISGAWFVISAAQLRGWMCGWQRSLRMLLHLFVPPPSFPFHSLPQQRFMTGEKIKEKQMQTLSQESPLHHISTLLTNCLIKFTWLSQQIRWEMLTHCPPVSHRGQMKFV